MDVLIKNNKWMKGVYNEVVKEDVYKIKQVDFIPDVVIDLGANIGTFTRHARNLFPKALIISVEPDKNNYQHFLALTNVDENMIALNKAIGIGRVWHGLTAANGSGETYLSEGLGYPKEGMEITDTVESFEIDTIMPDELIKIYVKSGQKSIIKIDIEGNEHSIWTHKPSMDALKKVDYITMEIHNYALHGGVIEDVYKQTKEAIASLNETHVCSMNHVTFYARKKYV